MKRHHTKPALRVRVTVRSTTEQEDDSLSWLTSFWYDWCQPLLHAYQTHCHTFLMSCSKSARQGSHRFPQTENKDPARTSLAPEGPALHVYASFFSPTHATIIFTSWSLLLVLCSFISMQSVQNTRLYLSLGHYWRKLSTNWLYDFLIYFITTALWRGGQV